MSCTESGSPPPLGDDLVLWFEHDLYDQLQLLEVLAVAPADARIDAIVVDEYLGELDPSRGPSLWELPRRRARTTNDEQAREAWEAVQRRAPLPTRVRRLVAASSSGAGLAAPLRGTCRGPRSRLGLTERRLLKPLLDGPLERWTLFTESQRAEEPKFLGDTSAFGRASTRFPDLVVPLRRHVRAHRATAERSSRAERRVESRTL